MIKKRFPLTVVLILSLISCERSNTIDFPIERTDVATATLQSFCSEYYVSQWSNTNPLGLVEALQEIQNARNMGDMTPCVITLTQDITCSDAVYVKVPSNTTITGGGQSYGENGKYIMAHTPAFRYLFSVEGENVKFQGLKLFGPYPWVQDQPEHYQSSGIFFGANSHNGVIENCEITGFPGAAICFRSLNNKVYANKIHGNYMKSIVEGVTLGYGVFVNENGFAEIHHNFFDNNQHDIQNIRNIFQHVYGSNVDFSGYIDKFYSKTIFQYDAKEYLSTFIKDILRSLTYCDEITTDRYIKNRIVSSHTLILTLRELLYQGKLNLRTLFKYYDCPIPLYKEYVTFPRSNRYSIIQFQGIIEMNILYQLFGSYESLVEALDYCRKHLHTTSELYSLDLHITNIIFLLDFKKNGVSTPNDPNHPYDYIDSEYRVGCKYKLKTDDNGRLIAHAIEGFQTLTGFTGSVPHFSNVLFFQMQLLKMLKKIGYYN